jgi:pyruvate,water dikinase
MTPTPLAQARDPARFGGKTAALSIAQAAGIPVPDGIALDAELVDAIVAGTPVALAALRDSQNQLDGLLAVRSSAIGEDSEQQSFAGQHETHLGVATFGALEQAVRRIHASARAPAALAYRRRRGIAGEPRMAILVQKLVPARIAGVLFTRDPVSGKDVLVIEAALGLGEVVVAGEITPDRFVLDRHGRILERTVGDQDEALFVTGSAVQRTALKRDAVPCLDDASLGALHALATRLDHIWSPPHDVEFAFSDAGLVLLQRRSLTAPAS